MPRKKKSKADQKAFNAALAGTVLTVLALMLTVYLQSNVLTSTSEAGRRSYQCGESCRRDSQCAPGLTCEAQYGTRKICTCPAGVCIQKQCKEILGDAVEGDRCDPELTRDAHRGQDIRNPNLACEEGLACTFVTRLSGSSYVCCDPANPNPHPSCVGDDLRKVAPNP